MFAHDVLKTLYSPIKAFQEIVKKPDVKGPLLILALILIITAGLQYASASKISDEEPMTNRDEWTESTAWIPQWASNGEPTRDPDKNASVHVGNYSIASSVVNSTYIWMKLTEVGSFNCSPNTGYERLSFWIKGKSQNGMLEDPNATLKLFSDNSNDYFKLDFGDELSNSSDEWSIVKVDLGPDGEGWERVGSPNWENVAGVEFALAWSVPANLTMKIDDLYFAKFVPLTKYFFTGWFSSLMMSALSFFFHWGVYGGILLLVVKVFGEKVGSWKALFVVVGYLFSVRIVYLLVTVVLMPILPEVRLENLAQIWYSTLPYQTILYFSFVTDIWMAALCTIAVRFFYTFTWKKAIGITVLASLLNFTLRPFIPI
ncbi:MAG: Yip1 family protein [Candidatus Bathyarchaeia archaeon]